MNPDSAPQILIQVRGVSKYYGDVRALADVSAEFRAGEIHAVLGENGAGKSTLMGLLSGFVVPDSGTIELGGAELPVGQPIEIRKLGVKMVHQHFMLVPQFSVSENLALSEIGGGLKPLDLNVLAQPAVDKGAELGWPVDQSHTLQDLPVGAQQKIEILKALAGDAKVLILDEPTAVLSPNEIDELFEVLRQLRDKGIAVILIAHKLSEIISVADRVTVLRKGEFIATALIEDTTEIQLAEWMVGEVPVPEKNTVGDFGPAVLKVSGYSVKDDRGAVVVDSLNLEIRKGEIFGIGGVDGNGQIELAEALAGIRPHQGQQLSPDSIAYIPQDRQTDGLALGLTISENMLLSGVPAECRWGPFLNQRAIRDYANRLISEYEIKVGSQGDLASSLSGGNQQKIVVSRNLAKNPELIICVNPTRGLDIKATQYVHRQLQLAAKNGAAILLISTDLEELSALAHTTQYLQSGRLQDQFLVGTS